MSASMHLAPLEREPASNRFCLSSWRRATCLLLISSLGACASYESAPLVPGELLRELNQVRWFSPAQTPGGEAPDPAGEQAALGPEQLAAFAVSQNPSLRTLRAQVGIPRALLVAAGRLPDPQIGWDAMDAIASQIVDGSASNIDFLAGLGFSVSLPRPGERSALKDAAKGRIEVAERRVQEAEWLLVRTVYSAYEELISADELLAQNKQLMRVVQATDDYFQRAQSAGVSTSIEASLAHGDMLSIRIQGIQLQARQRSRRERLNALLGLPPSANLVLARSPLPALTEELPATAGELVELSLGRRPDLAGLEAAYLVAEEELRLELSRQMPQFSLGTGIWLIPGIFQGFNEANIQAARANRESLGLELRSAVHGVRAELFELWSRRQEAQRELSFLESELLPNAEESLRLAGKSFDAGEATLIQILNVQRALVDARTRHQEAKNRLAQETWSLLSSSGLLLPGSPTTQSTEQE